MKFATEISKCCKEPATYDCDVPISKDKIFYCTKCWQVCEVEKIIINKT